MKVNVKDAMTTRVIWVKKDTPFRELAAALRGPAGFDVLARFPVG
jgi:hypothetical protein